MKLEDAQIIANDMIQALKPFASKIEIVGSIRRRRPEVTDVDILMIPTLDVFGFNETLGQLLGLTTGGDKIKRGLYKGSGIQIDIYLATESNYETLKLIRIGSTQHNMRLTTLAKRRGFKLHADGIGLTDEKGKVIARTDVDIFNALSLEYLPPEQRDPERYMSLWNTAKNIPVEHD